MPEYLGPGVYVEEVSFQPNAIGGVSTSITGFIGPTLFGPAYGVPELLTSFSEFQNIYGGPDPVHFEDAPEMPNYMALAVRAFFENGGHQLYIVRTFSSVARGTEESNSEEIYDPFGSFTQQTVCAAHVSIEDTSSSPPTQFIPVWARYPGSYGNVTVTFTVSVGQNALSGTPHDPLNPAGPKDPALRGVNDYDTVWISRNATTPAKTGLYWAENYLNPVTKQWDWQFHGESGPPLQLSQLQPAQSGSTGDYVKVITISVEVEFPGAFPRTVTYQGLTFHPQSPTSLSQFFAQQPSSRSAALTVPLVFDPKGTFTDGPTIARILMTQPRAASEIGRLKKILNIPTSSPPVALPDLSILGTLGYSQLANTDRQFQVVLSQGLDGFWPTPRYYEGEDTYPNGKTGLKAFEDLTDVSIVAAPGSTAKNIALSPDLDSADKLTIAGLAIVHCEQMRYRIAVLDSMNGQDLTEVSDYRGQLDSEYAALYYPWVTILDPVTEAEINLPPSGFSYRIEDRHPWVEERRILRIQLPAIVADLRKVLTIRGIEHRNAVTHLFAVHDQEAGDGEFVGGIQVWAQRNVLCCRSGRRNDRDVGEVLESLQSGFPVRICVLSLVITRRRPEAVKALAQHDLELPIGIGEL